MLANKIRQGGIILCPICGNKFKWSYKLDVVHVPGVETRNQVVTACESTPHKYMTHVLSVDKKVEFIIGCEKCCANIETEYMKMVDEENYKKNKQ